MRSFSHLYGADKTLASLSTRIQQAVRDNRKTSGYINATVIADDLQYNITSIITELILRMKFHLATKDEIIALISDFNLRRGTTFDFDFFFSKGWVRIINGEIRFPSVISGHLSLLLNDLIADKPTVPPELQSTMDCLLELYRYIREKKQAVIPKKEVEAVLQQHPAVDISFLIEKTIIRKKDDDVFYLDAHDYTEHLRNRIAGLLWLKLMQPEPNLDLFRTFVQLIRFFSRWPDDLESCLTYENIKELHRLSIELLDTEEDLADISKEVRNAFLDAPSYHHRKIGDAVPMFHIAGDTVPEILEEINYLTFHYHDLFDHQEIRESYLLLLRFIAQYDSGPEPYLDLRLFLNRQKNPFIIWELVEEIRRTFPEAIPFLLKDKGLIPLALSLIDKLDIDTNLLKNDDTTSAHQQSLDIKSGIWRDAFDYLMNKIAQSPHVPDYTETVAKILQGLAEQVFQFNNNNYQDSVTKHELSQQRYTYVLSTLGTQKIDKQNHFPLSSIRQKILPYLLEPVFRYVTAKPARPSHTEFLKLDLSRIDLLVELLRFASLEYFEDEGPVGFLENLPDLRRQITTEIFSCLNYYFTATEIDVFRVETTVRANARRGVGEFGVELVDWAYLYLHFAEYGLIDRLDSGLKGGLLFIKSESQYDEQNREQREKLVMYVKILLLAFSGIAEKKETASFSVFNPKAALDKLMALINGYALEYSKTDLQSSRIDIFKEADYWFNKDPYKQSLTSLLNKALNFYKVDDAQQFVDQFFGEDSIEIDRMLALLNKIDNRHVKNVLAGKIDKVDIDKFIKTRFTVTELEAALIEAVNSEQYYHFADPLLNKIEAHFESRKTSTPETRSFLFRVKLLLALKRKDKKAIQEINIPEKEYTANPYNQQDHNQKSFYLALHYIYNERRYSAALPILKALHTSEPNNVSYAFYLYKTEVLKITSHEGN